MVNRQDRVYGRLTYPAAAAAIGKGGYVAHRVFCASQADAVGADDRPCGVRLPRTYAVWKTSGNADSGQPGDLSGGATPGNSARRGPVTFSADTFRSGTADGWNGCEDRLMPLTLTRDELREAIRNAMQEQPDAPARAQLLYDIARAAYGAIEFLNGNTDSDDDEQFSAAKVSDEALAHQERIDAWELS